MYRQIARMRRTFIVFMGKLKRWWRINCTQVAKYHAHDLELVCCFVLSDKVADITHLIKCIHSSLAHDKILGAKCSNPPKRSPVIFWRRPNLPLVFLLQLLLTYFSYNLPLKTNLKSLQTPTLCFVSKLQIQLLFCTSQLLSSSASLCAQN